MLFQYGRYLTIASSREGNELPSNLQGLWQNRLGDSNRVPWGSDYHMNVNLQMNYWPTYVTNMAECALPLIDYVDSLREPGRVTAEVYTGVVSDEENPENGFTAHTQNTPFGWTCPGYGFYWGWSPAAVPWILQNCWEYYEYTGDVEFMRDYIYPMLREEAVYYDQILVWDEESQRMVSAPSYSPEHGPVTVGNTYEQSLIWQLYEDTIKAAEILGVDADKVEQWKDTQSKLDPLHIGDDGQLKEWYEETTIGSLPSERGHRHMSHLLGLYPGDLISVDNPEYMDAAIVSLEERGDNSTGWGMGHRINLWARTGDGNHAYKLIRNLFNSGIYPNLWDASTTYDLRNQTIIDDTDPLIKYDGWSSWSDAAHYGGTIHFVEDSTGVETIETKFYGTGIQIICPKHRNMGYIDIYIDGELVEENLSLYGEDQKQQLVYESEELEEGIHSIMILGNGKKNPANNKSKAEFDYFRVLSDSVQAESIEITTKTGAEVIGAAGGTLQMEAAVLPEDTTNKDVEWSVSNSKASIDENGLLTAGDQNGTVTVTAATKDGSGVTAEKEITIQIPTGETETMEIIDDRNSGIVYSSEWSTWDESKHIEGGIHYTTTVGSTIEYTFEGTGIEVITANNTTGTKYEVEIDDESWGQFDTYSTNPTGEAQQTTFSKTDLSSGNHTIEITVVENEGRTKMEFDAFKVYAPSQNTADKSGLQSSIEAVADYNEAMYTEESWNTLEEALKAAVEVMNDLDADQDQVDTAKSDLDTAAGNLALVTDTEAPSAVESLEAIGVEESTLVLKWKAASDNTGIAGYEIYQGENLLDTVTSKYYRVSGLENETEYEFKVVAKDLFGNSSEEAAVTVTTLKDTEGIKQPMNIRVTAQDSTTASLEWDPCEGEDTGDVTYRVYLNGSRVGTTDEPKITLTELEAGISYAVRVVAVEEYGNESLPGAFTFTLSPEEPVSKKTLEYFLNSAKEHVANGDTDDCVQSIKDLFAEAIAEGEAVMADEDATREEVMSAAAKLMKAIQVLDMKAGDKTDLEMAVELGDMIDLTKYVEAGQKEFTDALAAAKDVLADGDAMQEAVDNAWNALVDAMNNLRLKANKEALEELLDEVSGLDLDQYTEESAAAFRSALASAQAVFADNTLSQDDQQTVDDAVAALKSAREALVLKDGVTDPEAPAKPEDPETPGDSGNGSEGGSGNDTVSGSGSESGQSISKENGAVKTGDNTPVLMMSGIMLAALTVAVMIGRKKKIFHK